MLGKRSTGEPEEGSCFASAAVPKNNSHPDSEMQVKNVTPAFHLLERVRAALLPVYWEVEPGQVQFVKHGSLLCPFLFK